MSHTTLDPALARSVQPHVSPLVRRTPLVPSTWLSERTGWRVLLKCENLQLTGSFKVRGALAAIARLSPAERARGVLASSAGNHGQGLAWAARHAGVPCTIVTPNTVPTVKARAIEALGARRIDSPFAGYDDTELWTRENQERLGGVFVSPFDDPAVMAGGGGTLALEILEDVRPDVLVAPCGGGGLLSGLAVTFCDASPDTDIVGVNTEASPGMWRSLKDGRAHLKVDSDETLAEGIEGGVSERTFQLVRDHVDDVRLVSEARIREAMFGLVKHDHLVCEGSAATSVATLLDGLLDERSPGTAVLLLTGGNVDPARLARILEPR